MGAYSDSLRFRWEIAHDLGVRRQLVRGYVLGEHGLAMAPMWSSVRVHGVLDDERPAMMARLRRGLRGADFPEILAEERTRLMAMMRAHPADGPVRALRHIATLPPDLRVALKPTVIHATGSKTIEATATATVEMVRRITEGRPMEVAAQVEHAGRGRPVRAVRHPRGDRRPRFAHPSGRGLHHRRGRPDGPGGEGHRGEVAAWDALGIGAGSGEG